MRTSVLTLLAVASMALAAVTVPMTIDERFAVKRSLSGQATYYGGNVQGGACSFSTYTLPSGLMGTALSSSNWANSANCGGCVLVNHGGKSITAMVTSPIRKPTTSRLINSRSWTSARAAVQIISTSFLTLSPPLLTLVSALSTCLGTMCLVQTSQDLLKST